MRQRACKRRENEKVVVVEVWGLGRKEMMVKEMEWSHIRKKVVQKRKIHKNVAGSWLIEREIGLQVNNT